MQYGVFRAEFDASPDADLLELSRLLVIFYRESKDHARLVNIQYILIDSYTVHRHHPIALVECHTLLTRVEDMVGMLYK